METVADFILGGTKITAVTTAMKLKDTCSLEERLWQPRQCITKQRYHFADKDQYSQRMDAFELSEDFDAFWRLLRVPWTARRWNQSILEEINPEYSLEGLMLKLQYIWPSDTKSWLTGKDPNAGQEWEQEEVRMTEDEMVGWHHWLSEHEFEQTLGDSEGRGSLVCCSPWRCRVRHDLVTEQQ